MVVSWLVGGMQLGASKGRKNDLPASVHRLLNSTVAIIGYTDSETPSRMQAQERAADSRSPRPVELEDATRDLQAAMS